MLTMAPPLFSAMTRAAYWLHRKVPVRFIAMARFQRSKGVSRKGDWVPIPAQFTSTSILPAPDSISEMKRFTASGSATDGFVIWADNGSEGDHSGLLRVCAAAVVWGYNNAVYEGGAPTLELQGEENSSEQHVVRLAYDQGEDRFWVWRDGELIGDYLEPVNAQPQDFAFFGSYSSSVTATAEVDELAFDSTGAYAPGPPRATIIAVR